VPNAIEGNLDISPRSNDGAEHHEAERQQKQRSDVAAEPPDLTIGDDDDGQVLEDSVYRNR